MPRMSKKLKKNHGDSGGTLPKPPDLQAFPERAGMIMRVRQGIGEVSHIYILLSIRLNCLPYSAAALIPAMRPKVIISEYAFPPSRLFP